MFRSRNKSTKQSFCLKPYKLFFEDGPFYIFYCLHFVKNIYILYFILNILPWFPCVYWTSKINLSKVTCTSLLGSKRRFVPIQTTNTKQPLFSLMKGDSRWRRSSGCWFKLLLSIWDILILPSSIASPLYCTCIRTLWPEQHSYEWVLSPRLFLLH